MKKFFRSFHINVSLFFLPLALLYAISGVLYLSGFNQDVGAQVWKFSLPSMQEKDIPNAINQRLTQEQLRPFSQAQLKAGKNRSLMLGGVDYSAMITQKSGGLEVKIIKRSFWGNLIMLHKGKGKWYFNVLAFSFAFVLLAFYVSGILMSKNHFKKVFSLVGLGAIATGAVGYISIL